MLDVGGAPSDGAISDTTLTDASEADASRADAAVGDAGVDSAVADADVSDTNVDSTVADAASGDGGAVSDAATGDAAADATVSDAGIDGAVGDAGVDSTVPPECMPLTLLDDETMLDGVIDSDGDGVLKLFPGPTTPVTPPDDDGDGVPDIADDFPTDPARTGVEEGFAATLSSGETTVVDLMISTRLELEVDVYFLVDTSGSESAMLTTLRDLLVDDVVDPLCPAGIVDAMQCLGLRVELGLGRFSDYPVAPYGSPMPACNDTPYEPLLPIGSATSAMQAAIAALPTSCGGDAPESATQALYSAVTGNALGVFTPAASGCSGTAFGHPCFRSSAVSLVVVVSGADLHNGPDGLAYDSLLVPGTPSYSAVTSELLANEVKLIYVDPSGRPSRFDLLDLLLATNSASTTPFLLSVPSDGGPDLGRDLVDLVENATDDARVDVTLTVTDDAVTPVDERTFVPFIGAVGSSLGCFTSDGSATLLDCRRNALMQFSLTVTNPTSITDAVATRVDLPMPLLVEGVEERRIPARVVIPGTAPTFMPGSLRRRLTLEEPCMFDSLVVDAFAPGDSAISVAARFAVDESGLDAATFQPLVVDAGLADLSSALDSAAADAGVSADALRAIEVEVKLAPSTDTRETPELRRLELQLR